MSFAFDVISRNEIDTRSAAADAYMHREKRNDMVRLIWSKSIMPKIFEQGFIQKLITNDAHTAVFSFDVPLDDTIAWSDQRHIAIFQSFAAVADRVVKCVPWQIRVEFSHKVRPYIHVHSALLTELDTYLNKFGWKFTTTDEGFLLIPLNVYDELEKTHEMYVTFWEMCKSARGPSVTDLSWGDSDFKAAVCAAEPPVKWLSVESGRTGRPPVAPGAPRKQSVSRLFAEGVDEDDESVGVQGIPPYFVPSMQSMQSVQSPPHSPVNGRSNASAFRPATGGGGSNAAAGAVPE